MAVELVLNDLSCALAPSKVDARLRMSSLIQTIVALRRIGVESSLRATADINHLDLAAKYPLALWRNDNEVSREERTYFRSITTKAPVLKDIPALEHESLGLEVSINSASSDAFAAAWLLDAICVSFNVPPWTNPEFEAELRELSKTEDDLTVENVSIRNASSHKHAEFHKNWVEKRRAENFRNGTDLWQSRATFKHLIFCESVADHLSNLSGSDPRFHQILKKLNLFNRYAANWSSGEFDVTELGLKITTESEATLVTFSESRTFSDPTGKRHLFSLHARITPGAWRIYFVPDSNSRKVLIGYIGPHLPTVTHR